MTSAFSQNTNTTIRPFQYRDLEGLERLAAEGVEAENRSCSLEMGQQIQQIRRWYGLLKCLSFFPNPLQHLFCTYVAEQDSKIHGMIQVAPFNRTRSTWKVDRVSVTTELANQGKQSLPMDIGSQLLRYCFEAIWEARTWLIEVDVNDKTALGLYRQNGFQPLAQMTYWAIAPDQLQALADREPDLPNLLPVSNADAGLLHQLDTASMPPLVRQVFDRHIPDFKTSVIEAVVDGIKRWLQQSEVVSGYIFESQRKAAIGYFQLQLCRDGSRPHTAELTVHPAYTWLYPELMSQVARIAQDFPSQALQLSSTDYQPEREEYFEQIGAHRTQHTLMMSRSVWHKLRESKPVSLEGLQLSDVLQGFQPARKPVPGRISLLNSINQAAQKGKGATVRQASKASQASPPTPSQEATGTDPAVPPHLPDSPSC